MNKLLRHILAAALCVAFAAGAAFGQRQRNYIYLFDCTQSMQQYGIWEPAKTALQRTIGVQRPQPDARFAVIPFQGSVHPAFEFGSEEYTRQLPEMLKAFDGYIGTLTNTNLYDALQAGFDRCMPQMDNRVYLLTDGTDNVRRTPAVVALIRKWCASHRNTRLFYVTLDEHAIDPDIRAAIDECDDAFMVNCHDGVIPQIADIAPSEIYANTLELDAVHGIMFSEPGRYPLSLRCSDAFFVPELVGGCAEGQLMRVRLRPRAAIAADSLNRALDAVADADGDYTFSFDVVAPDASALRIANPTVEVRMSNRRQRTLSIALDPMDETVLRPGATSYPAFLFSAAKSADTIVVDLAPEFNAAAMESGSSATFRLDAAHGAECDYTLLCNGVRVAPGEGICVRAGEPARLGIVFGDDAATGRRYFTLSCTGTHELERLNGMHGSNDAGFDLRTTYDRDWNPLAVWLFWILVVLLAALVLWFAVLRRILYPVFKISALEFAGPGSYYVSKRVKGYRMARFTSRAERQGFLSRLFTGRVLIVRDDVWSPPLAIVPGNKRTARALPQKGWDFVPSRTLRKYESYELINSATGEKSQLTVS